MLNDAYAFVGVPFRTKRNETKRNETNEIHWYIMLFREYFFVLCVSSHVRDGHVYSAYPSGNNISAALQIPLCRLYGLTEVDYRAGSRP